MWQLLSLYCIKVVTEYLAMPYSHKYLMTCYSLGRRSACKRKVPNESSYSDRQHHPAVVRHEEQPTLRVS